MCTADAVNAISVRWGVRLILDTHSIDVWMQDAAQNTVSLLQYLLFLSWFSVIDY